MHIRFQGIEIGCTRDDPLYIADYEPPTTEMDTIRAPRLGVDGVHAGLDLLRSAMWNFSLTVSAADAHGVLSRAGALESAWKNPENRSAEAKVPLEYSVDHGILWFRVYGRALRYSGPKVDFMAARGHGTVEAQFEQTDPLHYSSFESVTSVPVVAATSTDGWTTPFTFPLTSTVSGEPRAGVVTNHGDRPAPVRVVFHGPCTDPRVWADGFEAGYRGSLAHDQTVTLDGLEMTATLRGGGRGPRHVAGQVTRKTRLSKLTVPPGTSNLWFQAEDITGTSFVDVFCRDAFTSMQ